MKKAPEDSLKDLEVLAPSPRGEENQIYVDKIFSAIENDDVKNLALIGGYGTGKSSIILQFKDQYNDLMKIISFLTFQKFTRDNTDKDNGGSNNDEDGNEIVVGNCKENEDAGTNNDADADYDGSISKLIQTEIFRQLYFGLDVGDIPKTKYYRIDKKYPLSGCLGLALSGFGLAMTVVMLFNLTNNLFSGNYVATGCISIIFILLILDCLSFLICFVCFLVDALTFLPLKKIAFFNLSADLADNKPDFEQMIDEIIYIFKQARYRVVVFEDLDRFENIKIMEELRQLNLILNNALDWKVTFIYTINDLLIKNVRDRVKLFDAIISVVPFMSEGNIRDHIIHEFSKHNLNLSKNSRILAVLAKYIADMRELRYLDEVFRDYSLIVKNNLKEPLDDARILGIAMIRCYYPEEISTNNRETNLDKLFTESSKIWDNKLKIIEEELSFSNDIEGKRYTFFDALNEVIGKIEGRNADNHIVMTWNNKTYEKPYGELKEEDLIEGIIDNNMILKIGEKQQYYGNIKELLDINRSKLEDGSGPLSKYYLYRHNGNKYYRRQENKFKRNVDRFFYVSEIKPEEAKSWSVDTKFLQFVKDLVEAGMMGSDYIIYSSRLLYLYDSRELLTFNELFFKRREVSYNLELSHEDIEELLGTITLTDFDNPALYNISFVNYLSERHDDRLNNLVDDVKDNDGADYIFQFLDVYCLNMVNEVFNYVKSNTVQLKIFEDIPVLYFIQKLASKYPIKTISHILDNSSTETSGAKRYYFLAAICGVNLGSGVNLRNDYSKWFSSYFESAVEYGLGTKMCYVMSENGYYVTDIDKIKDNDDALNYIAAKKDVALSRNNIVFFSVNHLKMMIESGRLSAEEILLMIKKISRSNIELFKAICESPYNIFEDRTICDEMCKKIRLLGEDEQFNELSQFVSHTSEDIVVNELVQMHHLSDAEIYKILNLTTGNLSKMKGQLRRKFMFPNTLAYKKLCKFLHDKGIISSFDTSGSQIVVWLSKKAPEILKPE